MSPEIITAIITVSSALILAGTSYWFTKKREREAELRREKLEHYKEFVIAINGIIRENTTYEGKQAFSIACNKLNLIAPQSVIIRLQEFQQEISEKNQNRTDDQNHDKLLSQLFYEMRKDLAITPKDHKDTFQIGLWSSGASSKQGQ